VGDENGSVRKENYSAFISLIKIFVLLLLVAVAASLIAIFMTSCLAAPSLSYFRAAAAYFFNICLTVPFTFTSLIKIFALLRK